MRPTKLLTISAIAGLSLISYGRSAQAAPVPVTLTGAVLSLCSLATTDGNAFSEVGDPPTQLVSTTRAGTPNSIVVICNDAGKSLELTISDGSFQNGTPSIKFVGASNAAASGIFSSTNTAYRSTGITAVALAPTKPLGDTGYVWAKIEAPSNKLLKKGDYNLVVTARIVP